MASLKHFQLRSYLMRYVYSILLLLPLCQIAYTAEPTCRFGQQRLFFPETQVALQFNCYDKSQVDWSLESADRKIISGNARVRDGPGTVDFKTPPLKSGVNSGITGTLFRDHRKSRDRFLTHNRDRESRRRARAIPQWRNSWPCGGRRRYQ